MPDIECDGNRSETGSELIDSDSGIVDDLDPGVDATRHPLDTADRAASRPDISEIHPDASPEFGDLSHIFHSVVDAAQIIIDIDLEATRELVIIRSGIQQRRSREGNALFGAVLIYLEREC